jgi:hypothetical protein
MQPARRYDVSFKRLLIVSLISYFGFVAYFLARIWLQTEHHFTYPLDDPYIHLALAEHIAHGHYGINAHEYASPSSSILWPLLLVPFAGTRFHPYLPLLLNIIFGCLTASLLARIVSSWNFVGTDRNRSTWRQAVACVLLFSASNLIGLTLMGMEHGLQILLSVCCAYALGEALADRPIPRWCLLAAILAPSVRYEDLSLTFAVCIALLVRKGWKQAATVGLISLLPVVAFSLFLHSRGLPLLPSSVLVKGNLYADISPIQRLHRFLSGNLRGAFAVARYFPLLAVLVTWAAVRARIRERRILLSGAALVGILQLAVGRFGWFGRYEVYAGIFLLLVYLQPILEQGSHGLGLAALAIIFCGTPYFDTTLETPDSSGQVFRQQYQIHRFVTEYYHGNYAVNDLGWASFQRRPGAYVLDIYGLGSVEASHQVVKTPQWLDSIVKRHNVPLVIIYREWFNPPATWTPLAEMCFADDPIVVAFPCVSFYSAQKQSEAELRAELTRFSTSLPAGVTLTPP